MSDAVPNEREALKRRAQEIERSQRRAMVAAIKPEAALHVVLKQLLERLGAVWAEVLQGSDEYGKDVLARFETPYGSTDYVAVVAKLGKVYGRVTGHSTLNAVLHQVDQAFTIQAHTTKELGPVKVTRVIVACTGDFAGNARREISERSDRQSRLVDYWDVDVLTDRLTNYLPEFFFDMDKEEHEYLVELRSMVSDLSSEMQKWGRSLDMSLDDVFIEPRVAVVEPSRIVRGTRKKKGRSKLVNIPDVDLELGGVGTLLDRRDSLVVIGPPGSGKSTLMKKAVHELCQRRMGPSGDQSALPIWLDTKRLALVPKGADFSEVVRSSARNPPGSDAVLSEALTRAGVVVFVDDLDLLPSASARLAVREWLELMSKAHKNLRVIAATRFSMFDGPGLIANFKPTVVFPFRAHEIRALLEKLLGADRAPRVLDAFLRQNEHSGLPQTPLVVTLLALLHRQEQTGEIPANIAELYSMVSEVFLGKWAEAIDDSGLEKYALLWALGKQLAYEMQCRQLWAIERGAAEDVLVEYLTQRGRADDALWVLDALVDTGLLVQGEGRNGGIVVQFSDRSFQEYFVAAHLVDHPKAEAAAVRQFADPWWTNVVMFLAGLRRDAGDIINASVDATADLDPEMALVVALQFGRLLQAASLSPTDDKTAGIMHATDLIQYFYAFYADRLDSAKVNVRFSRTSLLLMTAVFFAVAFESRHLVKATNAASWKLLDEFDVAEGDERFVRGIRALCSAAAAAAQGDYLPLKQFVESSAAHDRVFFGAVSWVIEASAPSEDDADGRVAGWNELVRTAKRLAPPPMRRGFGPAGIRRLRDEVRKLEAEPQLVGTKSTTGDDRAEEVDPTEASEPQDAEPYDGGDD